MMSRPRVDLVEATAHDCGLPVLYLHAPACNISVARNACLRAATAPLVAFIDDDEIASPDWLVLLIAALEGSHADVVLRPVPGGLSDGLSWLASQGGFSFDKANMGARRDCNRLHLQP